MADENAEFRSHERVSFTIMRRTFERATNARLSFSGGPHALVNMVDNMENAGSPIVSGSKEAMEVRWMYFKDWSTKYIAQHSTANMPFPAFVFPLTFTSSILFVIFTGTCGPPEELSLALVPRSYVVVLMIVKLAY